MFIHNQREVIGHRGTRLTAPENTMAAMRQAAEAGVDRIEFDIRSSKDGVLRVIHDETVDRTTDGSGKISDLTSEELDRLDAGSKFDAAFQGERIPTLGQVLDWARGTMPLNIEVKDTRPQVRELLLAELRQHQARDFWVTSADAGFIKQLREQAPEFTTGVVVQAKPIFKKAAIAAASTAALAAGLGLALPVPLAAVAAGSLASGLAAGLIAKHVALDRALAQTEGSQILVPNASLMGRQLDKLAAKRQQRVFPYTVNKVDQVQKFLGLTAVGGVITDDLNFAAQA
ncbi:MAG: glycerophosphodiester phosphodiesterase [Vulcanimicrobiota bacterium]